METIATQISISFLLMEISIEYVFFEHLSTINDIIPHEACMNAQQNYP